MINLYTILTFTFFHWMFDFFFQTDEMSKGKSHSYKHLFNHIQVYTIGLVLMCISNIGFFYVNFGMMLVWVVFNSIAHFFTDYITSRASSLLYKNENYHDFFVVVGIDQFIHYATMFASFYYITNI